MSVNPLQPREALKLRAIVSLAVAALIGTVASISSATSRADNSAAAGDPAPTPAEESTPSLDSQTPTPAPATPAATPTPAATKAPVPAGTTYRNGTYSATGNYLTSEGTEQIGITLTISNDMVTGASAQNLADSRESSEYQSRFISNYRSSVVGKPLASLSVGAIAGASLTAKGFNNAVAQIRAQAR